MTNLQAAPESIETLADLLGQLGGVSPTRMRFRPLPGTATEADVLDMHQRQGLLCELVEGVLVEKLMGFRESFLTIALSAVLWGFVKTRNLGLVTGADGMVRLAPGLVRIPDLAFISWQRLPERRVPTDPIPGLVPDLVVEVLSEGNTAAEMARKRREYFAAGVRLAWFVEPVARTVEVYTAANQSTLLEAEQILDGGTVLAGFSLPLAELFAELDRQGLA